jgi:hypothetical protein
MEKSERFIEGCSGLDWDYFAFLTGDVIQEI